MAANESEIANLKMDLQMFAEDETVETSTEETTTEETTKETSAETTETTEQTETNEPDVTTTQAFARRLKEATTKAKDELIAEMYGETHGIYTYADYQKALAEQREAQEKQQYQEQYGIDPDAIKPIVEKMLKSDPRYQRLEQMEKEANINAAVSEFAKEFPDLGIKSFDDIAKLPGIDKMTEYVNRGLSLNEAYKLANYGDTVSKAAQTAQQETIKKITANGESSPGSLSAGGENDFISQELFESKKNDQRWVIKNLSKIQKSRANW
jgi:hypothetical protein